MNAYTPAGISPRHTLSGIAVLAALLMGCATIPEPDACSVKSSKFVCTWEWGGE